MPDNKTDLQMANADNRVLEASVAKRAVRLAIGLYRLTDYFDDREPMKYSLRTNGEQLLAQCLSFSRDASMYRSKIVKDIKDSVALLISRFDVLEYSGLVSERNANLVKDELLSLNSLVENSDPDLGSYLKGLDLSKTDSTVAVSKRPLSVAGGGTAPIRALGLKTDRGERIIEHIRLKGAATIRDLTSVVKGCSEKTIQRELSALVEEGRIRREGERRWSRYLIAI